MIMFWGGVFLFLILAATSSPVYSASLLDTDELSNARKAVAPLLDKAGSALQPARPNLVDTLPEIAIRALAQPHLVGNGVEGADSVELASKLTANQIDQEVNARLAFVALGTTAGACAADLGGAANFRDAALNSTLDLQLKAKVDKAIGTAMIALRYLRNSDVMIVCPGTPYNRKPHPAPIRIGNGGGQPPSPVAPLSEKYDVQGFDEVVALSLDGVFQCSGTLLGRKWILTAAHCLTKSFEPETAYDKSRIRYYVYSETGTDCFRGQDLTGLPMQLCGRKARDVAAIHLNPGWTTNGMIPPAKMDTALLEIAFEGTLPRHEVSLPASLPSGQTPITMAGYGVSGSSSDVQGNTVLVGWNVADTSSATSGILQWAYLKPDGASSNCSGDSGGAIFLGRLHGTITESHEIAAVISRVFSDGDPGPLPCTGVSSEDALLTSSETRGWLCKITNAEMKGC